MPKLPTRAELEAAAELVYRTLPATPQIRWPLLAKRCECDVVVKHENHTPIGAFKVRGGLTYVRRLLLSEPGVKGVVSATRGNHGQSIALAARTAGLEPLIVVPHGNSVEKNRAMKAHGAVLIEHGRDFTEADEYADGLAEDRRFHRVHSYHPWLVEGVGTYGMEFLGAEPELDTVYVPIGLGSGMCGMIAAREALGLKTTLVGVVAANAPAYALSFEAGKPIATDSADTIADGVAVRRPHSDSLDLVRRHVDRVVSVSEAEILDAMRAYYTDTHNVAEGAGAAGLAALLQERSRLQGRRVGIVLTGGNVDRRTYLRAIGVTESGVPLTSGADEA